MVVGSRDLGGMTLLGTGKTGGGTTEVSGLTCYSGGFDVDLASPAGSIRSMCTWYMRSPTRTW